MITATLAQAVISNVQPGLVKGLGTPLRGNMCVEAAVCAAEGKPHGDRPNCVGEEERYMGVGLNDCNWSSPAARAKGMLRFSVAQLGSIGLERNKFDRLVSMSILKNMLPDALQLLLPSYDALYVQRLYEAIEAAKRLGQRDKCYSILSSGFSYVYRLPAKAGKPRGFVHVEKLLGALDNSWHDHIMTLIRKILTIHWYEGGRMDRLGQNDELLSKAAELAVQVLIDMKCPGTEYLYLIKE